jgi:hypothetical protein
VLGKRIERRLYDRLEILIRAKYSRQPDHGVYRSVAASPCRPPNTTGFSGCSST